MGGFPVLLMIAAMGITYGWHPDDSGGVEYVIQIPPDQLHQLERIGEISSAIDPAVAGRVSRVIIKVSNAPVRRITPPSLARSSETPKQDQRVIVVSDHSPVPIPEMDERSQAILIPAVGSTDHAAVMKPDANDPGTGPGFSFPSSVRGTAVGTAVGADGTIVGVDRAGRELGPRSSPQLNGTVGNSLGNQASGALNRIPPPTTRSPSVAPPQFTGSDPRGELARTRAGGPSTNPTDTRDNSWRDFPGSRAGVPSTEPVGPSGFGSTSRFDTQRTNAQRNDQSNAIDSISGRPTTNGLSPSDTFGRTPSGLTLPGTAADSRGVDRNLRTSPGAAYPQGAYSQYQQTQLDRQAAANNQAGRLRYDATADGQRTSANAFGQGSANTINPSVAAASNREQQLSQARVGPDSRFTAAEIASGAWSVDIYGRPLDREGRLLATTTRDPRQAYSSLGQPNANPAVLANTPAPNLQTQPRQGSPGLNQALPANANASFVRETNSPSRLGELARRDAGTLQTRPDSVLAERRNDRVVEGGDQARKQLAAQPLFNGLLLISFVANVYLIFWLKNLRLQFHDLVAAKRMTNANNAAT